MPTTSPKTIPMSMSRKAAKIEPSRTALVIIDMQSMYHNRVFESHADYGERLLPPPGAFAESNSWESRGQCYGQYDSRLSQGRNEDSVDQRRSIFNLLQVLLAADEMVHQWGLDNFDLMTIPPSFLDGFSDDDTMNSETLTHLARLSQNAD